MVGASCFVTSWQWVHMETLKNTHSHVNTHAHTHTHLGPLGSQLDLHKVTLSPSPRTPSYTRSQRGHLSHSGTSVWFKHLHCSPGCQLWMTYQHLQQVSTTVKALIPPLTHNCTHCGTELNGPTKWLKHKSYTLPWIRAPC